MEWYALLLYHCYVIVRIEVLTCDILGHYFIEIDRNATNSLIYQYQISTHKIAVATMHNYSTHMFTSVNRVECPRTWLFHAWHSTRCVHFTSGITQYVSIPRYGKCGTHEHVTRFVLPISCYCSVPYAYFIPYAYGTILYTIRVWYWYVPYAYVNFSYMQRFEIQSYSSSVTVSLSPSYSSILLACSTY